MKTNYNQHPVKVIRAKNREIAIFTTGGKNIDQKVVESFGAEWEKFHEFRDEDLQRGGREYFDNVDETMLNKSSYLLDVGCGSGRWTKYLIEKVGFIEAIDPSISAIMAADHLLGKAENVRLSVASVENIPFEEETFDFVMSIGVLHHLPDTQQAIIECIRKIKRGGYFYVYLYYNLENRGLFFKTIFIIVNAIRLIISSLSLRWKGFFCDLITIFMYMPVVYVGRFFSAIGLKGMARNLPLSAYQNKRFYVIRNDALDRFGTPLEQRFSRLQVETMMKKAGLDDIVISTEIPYYHAVGRKKE